MTATKTYAPFSLQLELFVEIPRRKLTNLPLFTPDADAMRTALRNLLETLPESARNVINYPRDPVIDTAPRLPGDNDQYVRLLCRQVSVTFDSVTQYASLLLKKSELLTPLVTALNAKPGGLVREFIRARRDDTDTLPAWVVVALQDTKTRLFATEDIHALLTA